MFCVDVFFKDPNKGEKILKNRLRTILDDNPKVFFQVKKVLSRLIRVAMRNFVYRNGHLAAR